MTLLTFWLAVRITFPASQPPTASARTSLCRVRSSACWCWATKVLARLPCFNSFLLRSSWRLQTLSSVSESRLVVTFDCYFSIFNASCSLKVCFSKIFLPHSPFSHSLRAFFADYFDMLFTTFWHFGCFMWWLLLPN